MTAKETLLIVIVLLAGKISFSQSKIDSLLNKMDPQKFAEGIGKKAAKLEDKIVAKSQRTLPKLQKQEEKIYRRMLDAKDSAQARVALVEIDNKYKTLQDKLKSSAIASVAKQYIPHMDTISMALKFFDQNGIGGNIKIALVKTMSLQDKFQQAEEIKKFIRERRQQLKEQLEKLGLVKQLKRFNKQAYYYAAQLKEYKEILKDSRRRERKAIELLAKTKLFQDFMRKNSMLASLFRMPGDPTDPMYIASLAGLQTRVQVNNLIQQQIVAGGRNAQAQFQNNMQQAESQLQQLKNKITQGGDGSSDDIMPEGFKPNDQKTKSFLKRLEYGVNIQSQRATNFFPVSSDIGLSLGYKLNDKSVIGIGASYKMGWGRGWNNIRFTQEGAGLRSYMDWKLKGSFWVSGGYEMNYKTVFNSIAQLQGFNAWSESGLIGLSKVIDVKSKFFKKTKLQMLWDFFSYQQIPKTQPILFRIGYNLK